MSISMTLKAQEQKTSLVIGYGYYEASFVAIKYQGVKKNQWITGAGYNFKIDNLSYLSLFAEYRKTLFERKVTANIGLKGMLWRQSDDYVIWGNLGINPNLNADYLITNSISINGSIGPIFNLNLYNHRKNYEKTAWVKTTDINFKLSLAYVLSKK